MPRSRESTSKVRTGCNTCKARRIKCDEATPRCRRCVVAGRGCEYQTSSKRVQSLKAITIYLAPAQLQPTLFSKDRSLVLFEQGLATALDEDFGAQFWTRLVLQLAHSEPPIRLAIAAASVVYEDVELSLRDSANYVSADLNCQKQWAVAVRSLSAQIDQRPGSILVPLICCLLFTCIEWLRGKSDASWLHVRNGVRILTNRGRASSQSSSMHSCLAQAELAVVEEHVVPIFSRLNLLYALTNGPTTLLYSRITNEEDPHLNLPDSRQRLYNICITATHFIYETTSRAQWLNIDIEDLVEQARLEVKLHDWRVHLEMLVAQQQTAGRPVNQRAYHTILVQYGLMHVWLRTFMSDVKDLADLKGQQQLAAMTMISNSALTDRVSSGDKLGKVASRVESLSFRVQRDATLWYTVERCPHPAMRRHALDLLRLVALRRGAWNACDMQMMVEEVIKIGYDHG